MIFDPHIEPKRFRLIFVALAGAALLLIWSGYFVSIGLVVRNADEGFKTRLTTQALILEDHASRALDTAVARLKSVSAFSSPAALLDGRLSPAALDALIFEDKMVRSLSLLDAAGMVLSSSTARNVGQQIAAHTLPARQSGRRQGEPRYGQVLPYRDLYEISGTTASPQGVALWLAALDVQFSEQTYQWVAAINPGLFQTLWARLDTDDAMEIRLLNYQWQTVAAYAGRQIAHPDPLTLNKEIINNVSDRERGLFTPTGNERLFVAYRASIEHPVVLAVIGDRDAMLERLSPELQRFKIAAIVASLLALGSLAIVFRGYLRYEASVIEMSNQAKAIGAHLMVSESNPQGDIINVNDAFLHTTGYSRDELIGKNHRLFNSKLHPASFYSALWQKVLAGNIWKGTFRNLDKHGNYLWLNATIVPYMDAWGAVTRLVAFYSDITEAISLTEKLDRERALRAELTQINRALVSEANTDPLTHIANRRAFDHFAEQALLSTRQLKQPIALLMLDLDHFKAVNDTYGHGAGDEVLKEVSRRWAAQIRTSDMLARLGGEEFCVVLPQATESHALRLADKIRQVTAETPVTVAQSGIPCTLNITVSIGLVSAEHSDHVDLKRLFEAADDALYEAKRNGRNRVVSRRWDAGRGEGD